MCLTWRTLCWKTRLSCYYGYPGNTGLYSMRDGSQPKEDQFWTSCKGNKYSMPRSRCNKQTLRMIPWSSPNRYLQENETSWPEISFLLANALTSTVIGWNLKVWPFWWKLLSRNSLWCRLLGCTMWVYLLSLWMNVISPEKSRLSFLQALTGPAWRISPMLSSIKNSGMPPRIRKNAYGIRNTPVQR